MFTPKRDCGFMPNTSKKGKRVVFVESPSKNLEKCDHVQLEERIQKLETELYDYQYTMGLLLIEKKQWLLKHKQLQKSLLESQDVLKREKEAHLIAVAQVEEREVDLKKALDFERKCVTEVEMKKRVLEVEMDEKAKFLEDEMKIERDNLDQKRSAIDNTEEKLRKWEQKLETKESEIESMLEFLNEKEKTLESKSENLTHKRKKIEQEWEKVDETKRELIRDSQQLEQEKIATNNHINREFEALRIEKESFAAKMKHEESILLEKVRDFENHRRDIEADIVHKKEEIDRNLQREIEGLKLERRKFENDKHKLEMHKSKMREFSEKDDSYRANIIETHNGIDCGSSKNDSRISGGGRKRRQIVAPVEPTTVGPRYNLRRHKAGGKSNANSTKSELKADTRVDDIKSAKPGEISIENGIDTQIRTVLSNKRVVMFKTSAIDINTDDDEHDDEENDIDDGNGRLGDGSITRKFLTFFTS